jgi:hypothetical protein
MDRELSRRAVFQSVDLIHVLIHSGSVCFGWVQVLFVMLSSASLKHTTCYGTSRKSQGTNSDQGIRTLGLMDFCRTRRMVAKLLVAILATGSLTACVAILLQPLTATVLTETSVLSQFWKFLRSVFSEFQGVIMLIYKLNIVWLPWLQLCSCILELSQRIWYVVSSIISCSFADDIPSVCYLATHKVRYDALLS